MRLRVALRDIIHKVESNAGQVAAADEEQKAALYRKLIDTVLNEIGDQKLTNDWQSVLHGAASQYNKLGVYRETLQELGQSYESGDVAKIQNILKEFT